MLGLGYPPLAFGVFVVAPAAQLKPEVWLALALLLDQRSSCPQSLLRLVRLCRSQQAAWLPPMQASQPLHQQPRALHSSERHSSARHNSEQLLPHTRPHMLTLHLLHTSSAVARP